MRTLKFKVVMSIIYTILLSCFIGLPIAFLAFGSDLQTRQSNLYPYQSSILLQDDFLTGTQSTGSVGALGWTFIGTVTVTGGSAANPGLYRIATGAVSGTISRLVWNTSLDMSITNPHENTYIYRVNTNDANTTVRVGMSQNSAVSPPSDGIYLEKLDADTNWFCVTRNGGVQTRTDSGVAITTSFTKFIYRRSSSDVQFTIGSSLVCTHTTNLPSSLSTPFFQIVNSAAADKTMDVDYFQLIQSGLSR